MMMHRASAVLEQVKWLGSDNKPPVAKFPDVDGDGAEATDSSREKRLARSKHCSQLIDFARRKLLCTDNPNFSMNGYHAPAHTAVVDVRLMLSFNSSLAAQEREVALASSHMRIVYTIPTGGAYMHSGYSGEPILAEAAARQINIWAKYEKINPFLQVLQAEHTGRLIYCRFPTKCAVTRHCDGPSAHLEP
jgi:hypothetical protein